MFAKYAPYFTNPKAPAVSASSMALRFAIISAYDILLCFLPFSSNAIHILVILCGSVVAVGGTYCLNASTPSFLLPQYAHCFLLALCLVGSVMILVSPFYMCSSLVQGGGQATSTFQVAFSSSSSNLCQSMHGAAASYPAEVVYRNTIHLVWYLTQFQLNPMTMTVVAVADFIIVLGNVAISGGGSVFVAVAWPVMCALMWIEKDIDGLRRWFITTRLYNWRLQREEKYRKKKQSTGAGNLGGEGVHQRTGSGGSIALGIFGGSGAETPTVLATPSGKGSDHREDGEDYLECVFTPASAEAAAVVDPTAPELLLTRHLHSASDDALVVVPCVALDRHSVISGVNADFAALCGVDRAFLLGRSIESVLEWVDADNIPRIMADIAEAARFGPEGGIVRRVFIRANGVKSGAAVDAEDPAVASSRSHIQAGGRRAGAPREGRFAVSLDVWQSDTLSDVGGAVVMRQPLAHAILNCVPLPLLLIDPADGCIIHWNDALTRLTELAPYDMLGRSAYSEFLGSVDAPLRPSSLPFVGDVKVRFAVAPRHCSVTLVEWRPPTLASDRHSDRLASSTALAQTTASSSSSIGGGSTAPSPILCLLDASSPSYRRGWLGASGGGGSGGKDDSSRLLTALLKVVHDFNRRYSLVGTGAVQRHELLTGFVDDTITLISQMLHQTVQYRKAASGSNSNSVDNSSGTYHHMSASSAGNKVAPLPAAVHASQDSTVSSVSGAKPALPPALEDSSKAGAEGNSGSSPHHHHHHHAQQQQQHAAPPNSAWGRLTSQDATCDSSFINMAPNEEFLFGRSAKCTLSIPDTLVSAVQFAIVRRPNHQAQVATAPILPGTTAAVAAPAGDGIGTKDYVVVLHDRSANGTFVNVKKVGKGRSCQLRHNDLITFRLSNGRFFMGFVFELLSATGASLETSSTSVAGVGGPATPIRSLAPFSSSKGIVAPETLALPPISTHPLAAATAASKVRRPTIKKSSNSAALKKIEWKIGEEVIGKGGNAEVYLGINLTNGKLIAVKRVPIPKLSTSSASGGAAGEEEAKDAVKIEKRYQSLQDEISVLSNAEHPNIVKYYGSSQSDTHLNILLEFVPGGSIRHLLDNFGALGDDVILSYLRQTLLGLQYLHSHNIIHSDMKSANILVTDQGKVKLSDFGTASLLGQANHPEGAIVGTLLWMAPELVRGESAPTRQSDIWSLGCTIIEMFTSEYPWAEYEIENEESIINLLKYTQDPPEIPSATRRPVIAEIARRCLQLNPALRPSCEELLKLLEDDERAAGHNRSHSGIEHPVHGAATSVQGSSMGTTGLLLSPNSYDDDGNRDIVRLSEQLEQARKILYDSST